MKRWGLTLALLASLGLNLGWIGRQLARERVAVEAPDEPRRFGGVEPGARLAERIGLEGAERERFLELQRQLAESVRGERRELMRARRELRAELTSERPDRARIEGLLEVAAERQRALDRAFAESVLATREVLSGERREAYLRFVERFAPLGPGVRGDRPERPGERRRPRGAAGPNGPPPP